MEEGGLGTIADVLVFALLVSAAVTALSTLAPVETRAESERYASSFAQSILLSFQKETPEQFGGFEYSLSLPPGGGSARRQLRHKTICQLLAECALLNMRVEVAGEGITMMMPNSEMDDGLRALLREVLSRTIAGRFGYRLVATVGKTFAGSIKFHYQMEVAEIPGARSQLCSETALVTLPGSEDMAGSISSYGIFLPRSITEVLVLELRLELWSL